MNAGAIDVATQAEALERGSQWVRRWSPAVVLRWFGRHRWISTAAVGALLLIIGAAAAAADPGTGTSDSDGGNVLISWMGIKDTDGVPVAKYTLTLNEGGWDDMASTMFAKLASITYEIYLCITTSALWLIKFVLSFEWLRLFTVPFQTINRGVTESMDRYGLAAAALAVLAIVVVWTVLAGKVAKAFSNIGMGMLMIGVAATIFANPLSELVGPDGLLAKGRDTGLQIAASVSDGKMSKSGDGANVDAMVSRLADRFLRSPTQMINFGQVSDSVSRKCRKAWSKGITNERGDQLKDDIKGCDSVKGAQMHQKSMGNPAAILVPLNICGLLALFLVAFACYFVWHVVKAAVQAMLYASLAPPAFAIGVIPGGPQTFAWKTVLDCFMAYVAMILFTAAFGAYNVILDQVFEETHNAVQSMFLTALVLAFGFALFGPLRRMFDRQRDTIAAKLSGAGGSGAGSGSAGGRGLWHNLADASRLKNEAAGQLDRFSGGHRTPGRVDSETESTSTSGGAPSGGGNGGGDGGGGGGSAAATVDQTHSGGHDGQQHSAAHSPETEQRAPAPEPAAARAETPDLHDRLAAARRIYNATRGEPSDAYGAYSGARRSPDGRYSLSEVA